MALCIAVSMTACSGPINPIEKFTDGEEIRYSGKASDLSYVTGRDRLSISFVLGPDPNVTEAKIFWNLKKESVTVPIDRSVLEDNVVSRVIEDLPENTYNFEIYTYDKFGNTSVPSYVTGKTYGSKYESTLRTRGIASATCVNKSKDVELALRDTIPANYSKGMEITYYRTDGEEIVDIVPNSVPGEKGDREQVSKHVLTSFDFSKPLSYRSLFAPEEKSLDVFASPEEEMMVEWEPSVVKVAKPYASYYIPGFDQASTSNASVLWDGSCTCVWNSYTGYLVDNTSKTSGKNYAGFSNERPSVNVGGTTYYVSPLWVTLDLGEVMKLSKAHVYFYYHFVDQFPKVNEWWAYTGEGEPKAGWDGWVKISENSYDADNMSLDEKKAVYAAGQTNEFSYDESVEARYYRFVCRKGILYNDEQAPDRQTLWRGTAYSLSEVTFWRYE